MATDALKRKTLDLHLSKKKRKKPLPTWPSSSTTSLPPLPPTLLTKLPSKIKFPLNEECTSLKIVPSGRHVVAGFTDGTVRLFDLTGAFKPTKVVLEQPSSKEAVAEESPSSKRLREALDYISPTRSRPRKQYVSSQAHQSYGAVACQIHARGVHTSLLMTIDISQDGLFCFAGVLRGSMELCAIDLSGVELYHEGSRKRGKRDLLDLVRVHRWSDAKLKGFGCCTRLRREGRREYLLFTGKGIKNIHIWSFIPPASPKCPPTWSCLYDTQTNGNTITMLAFRYDSHGYLQALSKSDDQKLRIWDLSREQTRSNVVTQQSSVKALYQKAVKDWNLYSKGRGEEYARPHRPPYIDVTSTENTQMIYGGFAFAGGGGSSGMYNEIRVVNLEVEDLMNSYNHLDIALPGYSVDVGGMKQRSSRSGRSQRGELKSVVSFAGLEMDGGCVLFELS